MNSKLKELIDEAKQNYEYNSQYPQLLSELVEHIVFKRELSPALAEELNVPQLGRYSQEEIEYIKEGLVEIINTAQSDELAGSAIETLSLFGDQKHVPIFRQKLELYLKRFLRANHPFAACIVALNKCGEKIKSGSSFGIDDVDKNIQSARDYLTKFKKNVPW